MWTTMKRKVKIKKKNFTIFIFFIMLFSFCLYEIGFVVYKVITTPKKEVVEKEEKIKKVTTTKKATNYEKKLQELDNIDQKITYFKKDNIDRYLAYKKSNLKLDTIQVIKDVNMNLDLTPYEDITEAINLNKTNILVNKYYYLDKDYIPNNLEKISTRYALSGMRLVSEAKVAFEDMAKSAAKENLKIVAMSTYRSYNYQVSLYNRYKRQDGIEKADSYSGRPGHSEHQTGLAVDIYNEEENYTNFEETEEFEWMQKHAHEYGFILRFPKDKENETGYIYESWHYRYVGKNIAKYIKEHKISLEEYIATH